MIKAYSGFNELELLGSGRARLVMLSTSDAVSLMDTLKNGAALLVGGRPVSMRFTAASSGRRRTDWRCLQVRGKKPTTQPAIFVTRSLSFVRVLLSVFRFCCERDR
jgi:hypothetical protein